MPSGHIASPSCITSPAVSRPQLYHVPQMYHVPSLSRPQLCHVPSCISSRLDVPWRSCPHGRCADHVPVTSRRHVAVWHVITPRPRGPGHVPTAGHHVPVGPITTPPSSHVPHFGSAPGWPGRTLVRCSGAPQTESRPRTSRPPTSRPPDVTSPGRRRTARPGGHDPRDKAWDRT